MMEHARNWAIVLNTRILNDDNYRKDYAEIAALMPVKVKRCLAFLLEEIKEDNPRLFERKANYILAKLK
jgi:hypothetical protein